MKITLTGWTLLSSWTKVKLTDYFKSYIKVSTERLNSIFKQMIWNVLFKMGNVNFKNLK
jgi:hypothetical protein